MLKCQGMGHITVVIRASRITSFLLLLLYLDMLLQQRFKYSNTHYGNVYNSLHMLYSLCIYSGNVSITELFVHLLFIFYVQIRCCNKGSNIKYILWHVFNYPHMLYCPCICVVLGFAPYNK